MAGKQKLPETVGQLLYWSYANLAMAHSAVEEGLERYGRINFMIRARLNKGLCEGTMNVGPILDDERLKMKLPRCCAYCGSKENLSIDHLIPRIAGGGEKGDNAVWACRSCNSSKGGRDLLVWMEKNDRFPPLMLLRRYLKLAIEHAVHEDLLDCVLDSLIDTPYALDRIPTNYLAPGELVLWVKPSM